MTMRAVKGSPMRLLPIAASLPLVLGAAAAVSQTVHYGPPITLAQAKLAIAGAEAEARRSSPASAIAIIDSGGHLVAFEKLDDTQFASIEIAQRKARTALDFKRQTKTQNEALLASPAGVAQLALT